MHATPGSQPPAKASRSKSKEVPADKPVLRSRKKSVPAPVLPEVEVISFQPTLAEKAEMIATTAYFIAAERHFAAGHELDDWLEAERRVHTQFPG